MKRIFVLLFLSVFLCFSFISCTQSLDELTKTVYITTVWKGSFPSAPQNPEPGWAYYNTTDKKSYIYDGEKWCVMSRDGIDGQNGIDGKSIIWKGSFASADAAELRNPQINWAYYNITDKKAYIYDGTKWTILSQDGKDGANGKNTIEINGIVETEGNIPSVISFPKLIQNGTNTMISFIAGNFEFENDSDNDLPQQTVFTFVLENDNTKKIEVFYDSEINSLELRIKRNGNTIATKRSSENLLDLYDQSLDGEKFILESATVIFGKGWNLKGVLKFTPSVCPEEIQMPLRKPRMILTPTNGGVQISLENISSDTSRIEIGRRTADMSNSWWIYIFNSYNSTNGCLPSTIQVCDSFVETGVSYEYYVYMNYGDNNAQRVASSLVTATGGLGSYQIDTEITSEGIIISIPVMENMNSNYISLRRDDSNYETVEHIDMRNKTGSCYTVTDYFIPLNSSVTYSVNIQKSVTINGDKNSIITGTYNVHSQKTVETPSSNCGYGKLYISNAPTVLWNESKITFVTEPELSIPDLPTGVSYDSVGFIYRKEGDEYRNYYLWNNEIKPNWEHGTYYPSVQALYGDQGYCIKLQEDQTYWQVYTYRNTESVFENMPQEIIIE